MPKEHERIAKATPRPVQKGTKHLVEKYGDRLIRVRYRYVPKTKKRLTTVEWIETETEWVEAQASPIKEQPPLTQRLGVRIEFSETELRGKARQRGAIGRPRQKL